jgi:hypothetical protein
MMRFFGAVAVASLFLGSLIPARADNVVQTDAVIDNAIKALGGEAKLKAAGTSTWKSKGTISIGGAANPFTSHATAQDLRHFRQDFEGEFGGNKIKGAMVLAGDKCWRKFGDMAEELDKDGTTNEARNVYLQIVPMTMLALKDKAFKVASAPAEKVDGKSANVLNVTGPDGKDFKLYFDRESGLPVRLVAKVLGFTGEEFTQETNLGGYKDFQGVKKATKIENKRDGEKFMEVELTEFKILDKVPAETFTEPK